MASPVSQTFNDSIFSPMHEYRCKICEQPMVNPQVLSCLHVLCEQCLMYLLYSAQGNLCRNDYSIDCPDCKKTVTIGLSSIGIGTAVKSFAISSSLFYCSSCKKDTNSVFRCQCCEKLFCLGCIREHNYVTCTQSDSNDTNKLMACAEHNMECKYYCVQCDTMVCVFCLTNKHYGVDHSHVSLVEARKDVCNRVQKLLDNAKDNTNRSYETISCLLEILANLRNSHERAKGELKSTYQSFMKLCERYFNDATDNLNAIHVQQEGKVKALLHDIEAFNSTIGKTCKAAKKLLTDADSYTLCKLRTLFPEQISELSSISQIDVKPTLSMAHSDGPNAEETSSQIVLNDFHEKIKLSVDEFALSLEPLEPIVGVPKLPAEENIFSSLNNNFKRPPLPINVKHKFGGLGDLNAEFNSPVGFCLDSNDDIIIADKFNHRIKIFEKNGTFKSKFGTPGKIDGRLWFPSKVALFNGNRFIVADQGVERSRLQIFSKTGKFIKKIPFFGISTPTALDVTDEGLIVIVDKIASFTAFIINEFGEIVRCFECKNYIVEPSDVTIYDSEIYICDYKAHCVAVFSMNGSFQRYIGNKDVFCYPSGIFVTEHDVFVSDSNNTRFHVARFARNGYFKESYECKQLRISYCHGFKMTSDGDGLTISKSNHCMFIFDDKSFKA